MAARTSSTSDADAAVAALLARARADEAVLGLWLGGSRGKGAATDQSDYDIGLVVSDDGIAMWRDHLDSLPKGLIDASLFGHGTFAGYAAWDSRQSWDRYSFVGVTALIDRTGDIQALIDDKARIPPHAVDVAIHAALDRFVNQAYRAARCRRGGDALASRLEAAQAPDAFLDALFALNGGRLRPYAKHLAWELETRPLAASPWSAEELAALLAAALGEDPIAPLLSMLTGLEALARQAGHGAALDAWGEGLDWFKRWAPAGSQGG